MAKTAKKAVKPAAKNTPKHRTVEDRLESIEIIMGTILYIFANAKICVDEGKPAQKKVAKKLIKVVKK